MPRITKRKLPIPIDLSEEECEAVAGGFGICSAFDAPPVRRRPDNSDWLYGEPGRDVIIDGNVKDRSA